MPTLPDRPLARVATPIDGVLPCWRCDEPVDDDGYCSACGAVTIPDDDEPGPYHAFAGMGPGRELELRVDDHREEHLDESPHDRDHRRHRRRDSSAAHHLRPPALAFGQLPAGTFNAPADDLGGREVDELI